MTGCGNYGGPDKAGSLRYSSLEFLEPVETFMTTEFTVGLKVGAKSQCVTVAAEDALIAALKVKHENPASVINYVRKRNRRGDRRHPPKRVAQA